MATPQATTVLVIEDDKFLVKVYENKLRKAGFNITIALNGQDGLAQAKAQKPALILLDLVMPILSGFETLQALKADPELQNIPVIILSNLGQDSDIKKGMDLGAIDFVIKANVPIQQVVEKIQSHLGA